MGNPNPVMDDWPDVGATLLDRMGIEVLEASAQRVVATMPVTGNIQPFGLLHGGASCVLAETLGSIGSTLHVGPDGVAVGVDINATHHRAVRDGVVRGVATPVHLGRSVACYEVVITDDSERRICTARITCHLMPRPGSGAETAQPAGDGR
jgi:1,4-dihydroxy-2-naphthoyl-CoA hydrolase